MELQVGVKALLQRSDGKFLLIRRSPLKYPEVGPRWDIPGGRINPGEPLLDNLRREIKEETNLALVHDPQLVAAQDILRIAGRHVVRLTYTSSIAGEPHLNDESMEFGWFSADDLRELPELDIYLKELITHGIILNGA